METTILTGIIMLLLGATVNRLFTSKQVEDLKKEIEHLNITVATLTLKIDMLFKTLDKLEKE